MEQQQHRKSFMPFWDSQSDQFSFFLLFFIVFIIALPLFVFFYVRANQIPLFGIKNSVYSSALLAVLALNALVFAFVWFAQREAKGEPAMKRKE